MTPCANPALLPQITYVASEDQLLSPKRNFMQPLHQARNSTSGDDQGPSGTSENPKPSNLTRERWWKNCSKPSSKPTYYPWVRFPTSRSLIGLYKSTVQAVSKQSIT